MIRTVDFAIVLSFLAFSVADPQIRNGTPSDKGDLAETVLLGSTHYALQLALTCARAQQMTSHHGNSSQFILRTAAADSGSRIDSGRSSGHSLVLRVAGETGLGSIMGIFFALPGGLIASQISGKGGMGTYGAGLTGMYVGYTLGSSLGVYLVGNADKQDVSFLRTLVAGVAGSGIGIAINNVAMQKGVGSLAPLIMPIAASIICVELIE